MIELTKEMTTTLAEYVELQRQEIELKERKHALQERLKQHLRGDENVVWHPEVGGVRMKVSYRSVSQVEYDEGTLRARLGDRYHALLEPDLHKLRAEIPSLAGELQPLLDRIGSPSPAKVKSAIESGTVSAAEFKGAFTKTVKEYITVAVLKEELR
jgi:hypothetical protein